jgi:hypothetical protein
MRQVSIFKLRTNICVSMVVSSSAGMLALDVGALAIFIANVGDFRGIGEVMLDVS